MGKNKLTIYCFAIVFCLGLTINSYANHSFYHGEKPEKKAFQWNQRNTKHFIVLYQDKYFDPEEVLERLSKKFNIQPLIAGIKIKLFINDGLAYTVVGAKTIYAGDENALTH